MVYYNQTQFVLLVFQLSPQLQKCAFAALLIAYIISMLCSLSIVVAIRLHRSLQTPMYYFLGSLASLEIWFVSSTIPKTFISLVTGNRAMSQTGCILQFYSYASAGTMELYQLAFMSLDRYLAICYPLRYSTLMTNHLCYKLIIGSYIFGVFPSIPAVVLMSQVRWCSNVSIINHFFCDGSALLYLSCSDTYVVQCIMFTIASFAILSSLITSIASYCCILFCIFTMSSSSGRRKTFSTCSSHLMVIFLTYGSCIFIYVRPAGTILSNFDKSVSVFNSIFCPFISPFIFTLRNKTIRDILRDQSRTIK